MTETPTALCLPLRLLPCSQPGPLLLKSTKTRVIHLLLSPSGVCKRHHTRCVCRAGHGIVTAGETQTQLVYQGSAAGAFPLLYHRLSHAGDYHRFHSLTAWAVEKRRHFVGDLFSTSPQMAKRLMSLFVLNERVALLGKWRYGFFGMVPVGATNMGSIVVNFNQVECLRYWMNEPVLTGCKRN